MPLVPFVVQILKATTNNANCTNHLTKEFVSFVSFVVLIIKFKVQTSNFKGTTNYANCTNHLAKEFVSLEKFVVVRSSDHKVQSPNFKFQRDYELCKLHESFGNKNSCH